MRNPIFILTLLALIQSCGNQESSNFKEPANKEEDPCSLIDSIHFEKTNALNDQLIVQFLNPLDSINKLIEDGLLTRKIASPNFLGPNPEYIAWFDGEDVIKLESDNSEFQGYGAFDPYITHEFFVLSECSWIYRKQRIKLPDSTFMEASYLSFNSKTPVNCLREYHSETDTVFNSSSLESHPVLDPILIYNSFNQHKNFHGIKTEW